MPTYRITDQLTTYAVVDIVADCPEDAILIAENDEGDLDWSYDTDFDSGKGMEIEQIKRELVVVRESDEPEREVEYRGCRIVYRMFYELIDEVGQIAELDAIEDEIEIARIAQVLDARSTLA